MIGDWEMQKVEEHSRCICVTLLRYHAKEIKFLHERSGLSNEGSWEVGLGGMISVFSTRNSSTVDGL
jgi:hypothetical protein